MGNEQNKELLVERIREVLNEINKYEAGSKEREKLVEELNTLYKLTIDEFKVQTEDWNRTEQKEIEKMKIESEEKIRIAQIEADEKKSIVDCLKVVSGGLISGIMANRLITKIIKFEETGVITTKALGFIPKIKFW